ncbi:MAG: nucleotidyltransferase domain-containing protein [Elusimicrobia bacterium]|nr:nucleotidyltransferase domain-containing protein [Elusimicrobiota bacterium]
MKVDERRKWIKAITTRIAEQVNPEKIVLFGSFAYGKPGRSSDIDLLVVCNRPQDKKKRYKLVDLAIGSHIFPVDVLVRSSAEISRRLDIGDSFIHEIMNRGKVLYESHIH